MDYIFLRTWLQYRGQEDVAEIVVNIARQENAPHDAMFRTVAKWVTVREFNQMFRQHDPKREFSKRFGRMVSEFKKEAA